MIPVDWDDPNWGGRVHIASDLPDAHALTEDDAERRRG